MWGNVGAVWRHRRAACGQVTTGLREGAVRAVPKAATHLRFDWASASRGAQASSSPRALPPHYSHATRGSSNQHAVSPVCWRLPVGAVLSVGAVVLCVCDVLLGREGEGGIAAGGSASLPGGGGIAAGTGGITA